MSEITRRLPADTDLGQPLRVVAQLRNNRLIRAREALGYKSCAQAAEALKLPYVTLSSLESLRVSPKHARTGRWTRTAAAVAVAYGCKPEDLWPDVVLGVESRRAEIEVGSARLFLTESQDTPDRLLERAESVALVKRALVRLTPQQRAVFEAVFGLGEDLARTQAEVADDLGLSRARVGQILERAVEVVRQAVRVEEAAGASSTSPAQTCPVCAAFVPWRGAHNPRDGLVEREAVGGGSICVRGRVCDRVLRIAARRNPVKASLPAKRAGKSA